MRVTHVITRLIVGGAQENTIASVLGLREKPGLEVDLVAGPTLGPEGSLESLVSGQPRLLTIVPQLVRPLHPWKDGLAWKRLTELFRARRPEIDRKSTRLNSRHLGISYAVFCLNNNAGPL